VNPCSRVLRKLSGELTIIQNWEARPSVRPDFRLRRGRPGLAGLSPVGTGASGVSDTIEIVKQKIQVLFRGSTFLGSSFAPRLVFVRAKQ